MFHETQQTRNTHVRKISESFMFASAVFRVVGGNPFRVSTPNCILELWKQEMALHGSTVSRFFCSDVLSDNFSDIFSDIIYSDLLSDMSLDIPSGILSGAVCREYIKIGGLLSCAAVYPCVP